MLGAVRAQLALSMLDVNTTTSKKAQCLRSYSSAAVACKLEFVSHNSTRLGFNRHMSLALLLACDQRAPRSMAMGLHIRPATTFA